MLEMARMPYVRRWCCRTGRSGFGTPTRARQSKPMQVRRAASSPPPPGRGHCPGQAAYRRLCLSFQQWRLKGSSPRLGPILTGYSAAGHGYDVRDVCIASDNSKCARTPVPSFCGTMRGSHVFRAPGHVPCGAFSASCHEYVFENCDVAERSMPRVAQASGLRDQNP